MDQVKAQTARSVLRCSLKLRFYVLTGPSMFYKENNRQYLLNLIDTPVRAISLHSGTQVDLFTKGHVDFSWEVSRSMVACQGALLLVDASQGVQAQSLSVFHAARERGLKIIPVLNKVIFPRRGFELSSIQGSQVDLPTAQPNRVKAQMHSIFGIDPTDVLHISAKTGEGISDVLRAIVERIPPPSGEVTGKMKAFLFDSSFVSPLFLWYRWKFFTFSKIRQVPRSDLSSQHSGRCAAQRCVLSRHS
jgi:translation elongation factor EF-4